MIIIGDAHGKIKQLKKIIQRYPEDDILQLGDLGVGFTEDDLTFPERFKFIRGNHDNPEMCRSHPNFLGDYGVFEKDNDKMFYVSGARSVDGHLRIEGHGWWRDEELSYVEQNKALQLYETVLPNIVFSHDCPMFVLHYLNATSTNMFLETLFQIHRPELWFFGHHHTSVNNIIGGTRFICLPELESFSL